MQKNQNKIFSRGGGGPKQTSLCLQTKSGRVGAMQLPTFYNIFFVDIR